MSREPMQQADLLNTFEPTTARNFVRPQELLDSEVWLAMRLKQHGVHDIFGGTTDSAIRKQRFRQAIVEHGLQSVMACQQSNERVASTYAETFESMYDEPLEPEASKRAKHKKATPGATVAGEGSVLHTAEPSRPPELPDDDDIAF